MAWFGEVFDSGDSMGGRTANTNLAGAPTACNVVDPPVSTCTIVTSNRIFVDTNR